VTDDGLVLIDSGWPQSLYMLLENIRSLSFDYRDVKHIVHTHGHIDHFGGTRALVALSQAKTYIGAGDEDAVTGRNELAGCIESNRELEEPFTPDVIIHDKDRIAFGNKVIEFVSTPGHTKGTLSLFMDLTWKGKTYRAGMFGGAGLNTLQEEYLARHGLSLSCREEYLESVDKLLKYKVDIHLGNHVRDNRHLEKMQQKEKENDDNPFIDENSWRDFLTAKRKEVEKLL
jgi:metallo-beta-lactamase class B